MSVVRLYLRTSELREGDTVVTCGIRVHLGGTRSDWEDKFGRVYRWRGIVTNLEEVKEHKIVPVSWLYDEKWTGGGWRKNTDADPHWDIQGNDLAMWSVERPLSVC